MSTNVGVLEDSAAPDAGTGRGHGPATSVRTPDGVADPARVQGSDLVLLSGTLAAVGYHRLRKSLRSCRVRDVSLRPRLAVEVVEPVTDIVTRIRRDPFAGCMDAAACTMIGKDDDASRDVVNLTAVDDLGRVEQTSGAG